MCGDVGGSRPPRRWSSVDLPEPDLPSRATFSLRRTSSETPRNAQTRTDLPDVHSLVTSHKRTAGVRVAEASGVGEKKDIGGGSLVGYPILDVLCGGGVCLGPCVGLHS